MSSKDAYHRITHTQTTGIGNASTPEVALQMPTSRTGNALWELVNLTYTYTAGTAANAIISIGEATGFAPKAVPSVFEGTAMGKSTIFHHIDLANEQGPVIVAPDANSKIYAHFTFTGSGSTSTDNAFVLRATFRQLKGSNITKTV